MKRITRMLIFSAVALFLTSFWNDGFKVNFNPDIFVKTVLLVALFYYLVVPISKIIFLPINFLTLGLLSSILYFILFYVFITRFSLVQIKPWDFQGIVLYGLTLKSFHVNYLLNIALSSVSLSIIIKLLELLI
ncbi:hypothetical protein A2767_00500 [Candidatus Roizmanbacteria bacterium RIFCSPHIGHO2_01_FULL_35_10]|uniref:Uncharacterized protein n=1 Tax=Candidatus Roizmanbacteria bacterium RIFCSPLOWO2_01_FULL_35_13 TaxID=1802055 RepID=A0A1F7IHI0_9BACT|nr:MAG: hypothetical protein A2767_00500 [Candidatus Roizmanbacteria bacterium RIFCSPHIGHO2_01_FULL_35_10]OGK42819.1 MAG: hypothetical protein A3A74_01265 [Candidatus Roizmanbacteria bacterium RIFCSPLOWO2_01_FULL_35_13]